MGSITDTPDTVVNVYDFSDKKNAKKKEAYIMEGEIQNIILDSQNGIIKISTVIRNVHNQFRLIPEPFYTKMSWTDKKYGQPSKIFYNDSPDYYEKPELLNTWTVDYKNNYSDKERFHSIFVKNGTHRFKT